MSLYIKGMGNISPQHTFGHEVLPQAILEHTSSRMMCHEPDYAEWLDVKTLRRMSRIVKMGVTCALYALRDAGISKPHAIITGTAFGCMEDTGMFITKLVENQEQALNPTPFINSTHNTIGSQIALLLPCEGYNQTYTQRAFSFENALTDALLMGKEHETHSILVGGIDETTDISFEIMKRFGFYAATPSNLKLYQNRKGTIQGEGAAFFVVSAQKSDGDDVLIRNVKTIYKPSADEEVDQKLRAFMESNGLTNDDIDLILVGKNGVERIDASYDNFIRRNFTSTPVGVYKHICGEYSTANAFAVWLAASILKTGKVSPSVTEKDVRQLKRILVYNQFFGNHHSFIILEAC